VVVDEKIGEEKFWLFNRWNQFIFHEKNTEAGKKYRVPKKS
jgi:hypothetical protein